MPLRPVVGGEVVLSISPASSGVCADYHGLLILMAPMEQAQPRLPSTLAHGRGGFVGGIDLSPP